MHSATIKYFKTLELIHFQLNSQGGQAKAKEGRMLPPPPERNPTKVYSDQLLPG